jgi:hypothetical protein
MRILSFDVGIKNLAYCYIDTCSQTILDWAVVDLCGDKRSCNAIVGCNKNAPFMKNEVYYCNKHIKEFLKTNNQYKIPDSKINCEMIMECSTTNLRKIATSFDIANKKINVDELRETICDYIDENLIEHVLNRNAKNVDLIEIGVNLDKYFNKMFSFDNITNKIMKPDIILIENQISPIANRMKTIQGMIAQFFITHFRNETNVLPVKFVSSSNKLKGFVEGKTTYDERKKKGIEVTIELVSNNSENKAKWLELFKKHSKKDDLADSYLQALWYSRTILKL